MAPIYQELRVPGQAQQSFSLLDAFVPVSGQSQIQTLSGFMIAGSDPGHYGQLQMFVTPRDKPVNGPAIVAAQIDATPTVSQQITLLNSNGSSALLGNVLMIPVADSLLYIQPLYVESSRNAFPELQRVIAVYGKQVADRPHAVGGAVAGVPGPRLHVDRQPGARARSRPRCATCSTRPSRPTPSPRPTSRPATWAPTRQDIQTLESNLQEVQQLTGGTVLPSSSTTTTTSTTSP